jgi:ABC-type nitrate/sulfonate/bicarbonate transport system substrate-binding protein
MLVPDVTNSRSRPTNDHEARNIISMSIKLTENFRAVFYAPFYAIQALGFYAREDVEVELMNSPAPAAAEADLSAA